MKIYHVIESNDLNTEVNVQTYANLEKARQKFCEIRKEYLAEENVSEDSERIQTDDKNCFVLRCSASGDYYIAVQIIEGAIKEPEKSILITHYSFDPEVPAWIFDSVEEAKAEMKKQFNDELKCEKEALDEGESVTTDVADDWTWASITKAGYDYAGEYYADVIEWTIANVRSDD